MPGLIYLSLWYQTSGLISRFPTGWVFLLSSYWKPLADGSKTGVYFVCRMDRTKNHVAGLLGMARNGCWRSKQGDNRAVLWKLGGGVPAISIGLREAAGKSQRRGMEEKWKMLLHILTAELSGLMMGCWVHWKEMNQGSRPPVLCFLYSTYHNYFLDLFFCLSVSPMRSTAVFILVLRLSAPIKNKNNKNISSPHKQSFLSLSAHSSSFP